MKVTGTVWAAALGFAVATSGAIAADDATLIGFSSLPADTFAAGPPSGALVAANGRTGPFASPPVQGFSGVQFSGLDESFWFLSDNGYGSKANSADYLLRLYRVDPNFKGLECGGSFVSPDCVAGGPTVESFIQLADPAKLIPFPIVNQNTPDRLLTGADFDVESFVFGSDGSLWIAEEFGPYVLHFDARGALLAPPVRTPDLEGLALSETNSVLSPDSPELGSNVANLPRSKGFEGMAFSVDRKTLYPLLEGSVAADTPGLLRIYKFDTATNRFSGFVGFYPMGAVGNAIGDFSPVNDHEFLVLERDNGQGSSAQFKKVFLVDLSQRDEEGVLSKREVANLMTVRDPQDLNADDSTLFTFPFVTIENVVALSDSQILVANDNNYPFSLGRPPAIDNDEMIVLQLAEPLSFDERLLPASRRPSVGAPR